ncbi:MAG: hypothetical protein ACRDMX_12195 [Solirubrobacteraceae bacterium]
MRVQWVHPTWRDLVIERLAIDRPLRRRFLARCGLHGTLLALSVAGGADGQRRLPLIGSDEDWDAVGDRLYALIPKLEEAELAATLSAIEIALVEMTRGEALGEARVLARAALTRSAERWQDECEPIPLFLLEAWLALSGRLHPPSAPPSLAATWAALLPARVPALDDEGELARFVDWLTLCEILSAFSPRLLRSLSGESERIELSVGFMRRVSAADARARASEHVVRAYDGAARLIGSPSIAPDTAYAPAPASDAPSSDATLVQRVLADL